MRIKPYSGSSSDESLPFKPTAFTLVFLCDLRHQFQCLLKVLLFVLVLRIHFHILSFTPPGLERCHDISSLISLKYVYDLLKWGSVWIRIRVRFKSYQVKYNIVFFPSKAAI